jgi:hypothetical protein
MAGRPLPSGLRDQHEASLRHVAEEVTIVDRVGVATRRDFPDFRTLERAFRLSLSTFCMEAGLGNEPSTRSGRCGHEGRAHLPASARSTGSPPRFSPPRAAGTPSPRSVVAGDVLLGEARRAHAETLPIGCERERDVARVAMPIVHCRVEQFELGVEHALSVRRRDRAQELIPNDLNAQTIGGAHGKRCARLRSLGGSTTDTTQPVAGLDGQGARRA